jgi:N-acetyl-alpha-D-glucosaminyl L-malate synthase BshA
MKVGITCYPTYGGSGIVATELGLELATRGHEVHFITYANPIRLDPGTPRIHYHEVEVSNYPLFQYPPYCLALASQMAEVAERQHLDLLHVHYAIPHSTAAMLARQMMESHRRLPFTTTLHGTDITIVGADRSYFPITKYSIEQSDGVTTISDYVRVRTLEFFGVRHSIDVIPNFVNCNIYRPAPEKRPSRKRLMHISNFRPVKRSADCVRILAAVRRSLDAELWMVGDGPDRSQCEELAYQLGIQDQVQFLGKQDHVERLFPQAHVLLMPSELEAFGLAALEAQACGVPPVATNCGGVPELINDGVDGFLAPVGDIEEQASAVVKLLSSEAFYQQISTAARHNAESRFCASMIIPLYEQHYEKLLAR